MSLINGISNEMPRTATITSSILFCFILFSPVFKKKKKHYMDDFIRLLPIHLFDIFKSAIKPRTSKWH